MTLWIATTADEYELPIAVEESAGALSEKLGVKKNTIHVYACESRRKTKVQKNRKSNSRCGITYRIFKVKE